eukprot:COSAG04_NODE_1500_length_6520_cov_21.521881_4_plen_54_part_00
MFHQEYDCVEPYDLGGAGNNGAARLGCFFESNSDSSGRRGERSAPNGGGWWFE